MLLNPFRTFLFLLVGLLLIQPFYIRADKKIEHSARSPMLRQEIVDIASRDLFYGQGGKENSPSGKFKFIKKSGGGSQPKFIIEDQNGIEWKVKIGEEAQSETVAVRLLWAVGYFTDETYYLPEMRLEGTEKLKRDDMLHDGVVRGARLERTRPGKEIDNWSWYDNPFIGTTELNQLKVMMALINNWDLKESNNSVYYDKKKEQFFYYISDLGATFGRSGGNFKRSKNVLEDYVDSKFIQNIGSQHVDFFLHTRPTWMAIIYLPYWLRSSRMSKIVKNIPRSDARQIGQLLAQLSDEQISDAFRAADYKHDEVQKYSAALRARINELIGL